jgi:hypothetical protein
MRVMWRGSLVTTGPGGGRRWRCRRLGLGSAPSMSSPPASSTGRGAQRDWPARRLRALVLQVADSGAAMTGHGGAGTKVPSRPGSGQPLSGPGMVGLGGATFP